MLAFRAGFLRPEILAFEAELSAIPMEALTIAAENILRRLDEPGVFDFLTDYSERFFPESLP